MAEGAVFPVIFLIHQMKHEQKLSAARPKH